MSQLWTKRVTQSSLICSLSYVIFWPRKGIKNIGKSQYGINKRWWQWHQCDYSCHIILMSVYSNEFQQCQPDRHNIFSQTAPDCTSFYLILNSFSLTYILTNPLNLFIEVTILFLVFKSKHYMIFNLSVTLLTFASFKFFLSVISIQLAFSLLLASSFILWDKLRCPGSHSTFIIYPLCDLKKSLKPSWLHFLISKWE